MYIIKVKKLIKVGRINKNRRVSRVDKGKKVYRVDKERKISRTTRGEIINWLNQVGKIGRARKEKNKSVFTNRTRVEKANLNSKNWNC